MTDPDRLTPARKGASEPVDRNAAPRDPIAGRAGEASGVESPGGSAEGDPDALDQSVGREDGGQGDARSRDGAI
ncbi:hypothetical protein [Brevundimonas sp.]|uniref:hypothetical protein n=1 Tax=Brevundimonas sp. TaxID=1871086 RepID=UPI0027378CD7|nr:hypothetical protein [Brevundimonas sp.]MDP3801285.1 hypothetical protein [Brevundimonas sp.]